MSTANTLPELGAPRDVYRYRKQRGVNLGKSHCGFNSHWRMLTLSRLMVGLQWPHSSELSVQPFIRFVLEKWITPHPFRNAGDGESDLQVASGQDARKVLEEHWASWIQDSDWNWIVQHGYNTVRIPVCMPVRFGWAPIDF